MKESIRLFACAIALILGPCWVSRAEDLPIDAQLKSVRILIDDGNYDEATALLINILNADPTSSEKGETYLLFAEIAQEEKDWDTFADYLAMAEEEIGATDENPLLTFKLSFLRINSHVLQNPGEALSEFRRLERDPVLVRVSPESFYQIEGRIGVCHLLLENYDSAAIYFDKAITFFKIGHNRVLSNLYQNKAYMLLRLGATDSIPEILNQSIAFARSINHKALEIEGLTLLGQYYTQIESFDEARKFLDSARRLSDTGKYYKSKFYNAQAYSEYYEATKDFQQALYWNRQYEAFKDSIGWDQLDLKLTLADSRRKIELQEDRINQEKNRAIAIVVALGLIIIISFLQFRLIRIRNKTARELNDSNRLAQAANEELTNMNEFIVQQNEFILRDKQKTETYLNKIVEIANSNFVNEELDHMYERVCLSAQQVLQVKRISFWTYNEDEDSIACRVLCVDAVVERNEIVLTGVRYPNYFNALRSSAQVVANDAANDPATAEFAIGYLDILDIKSMLDTPVLLNGKLYGVICCEQTTTDRTWEPGEVIFLQSLCSFVTIGLLTHEIRKKNKALASSNEFLEEAVAQRTSELKKQNDQLSEYAFINSHMLRAPLARILGISSLLLIDNPDQEGSKQLLEALSKSCEELDGVIRQIADTLYEGNDLTREAVNAIIQKHIK